MKHKQPPHEPPKVSWWTIPHSREEFQIAWRAREQERLHKQNQVLATQAVKTFGIVMHKQRKKNTDPDEAA